MTSKPSRRSATPHVFISSTIEDLEPYRAAAKEAVIAAQMLPVMSDHFPAGAEPALGVCLGKVSQTDVLIVLVAHRYGWRPKDQSKKHKPRKSITWLECLQAAEVDKRVVLAFFIGQKGNWPAEFKEEYRLAKAAVERKVPPELTTDVTEALDGLDGSSVAQRTRHSQGGRVTLRAAIGDRQGLASVA